MTHALDTTKTANWRSKSPKLRRMEPWDRNRRWISLCGERLLTPRHAPHGEPDCNTCREVLGLPQLRETCAECNGSGEARDLSGKCPICNGEGEVLS